MNVVYGAALLLLLQCQVQLEEYLCGGGGGGQGHNLSVQTYPKMCIGTFMLLDLFTLNST